jgi:hypothetical protein
MQRICPALNGKNSENSLPIFKSKTIICGKYLFPYSQDFVTILPEIKAYKTLEVPDGWSLLCNKTLNHFFIQVYLCMCMSVYNVY